MGIQKRSDNCFFNMVYLLALLFSATFRKKIEKLARDILIDPIRVVQGDIGEVSLSGADESQGVIFTLVTWISFLTIERKNVTHLQMRHRVSNLL